MTISLRLGFGVCAAAACLLAATPTFNVQGSYVEARTADVYTGPCFANSEMNLTGQLAVFGWQIGTGSWNGVSLDGLSVVAAVRANSTLGAGHTYPVRSILLVDQRASLQQRLALVAFAKRMSRDLLDDIRQVEATPIQFEIEGSIHEKRVRLSAGTLAHIQTRDFTGADHVCSHEDAFYDPLTELDHAMPAYAIEHDYQGSGLNATWRSPDKRSAYVGTFHLSE
jgi:hypothetical protein